MFIDKATIKIQSGAGGNGMVAWRREKYVPFGGPAGGDGGHGGHVYLESTQDMNTLLDFQYQSLFKAEDGEKGGIKSMHGKAGQDLTIRVPCGTIVRNKDTGEAVADLKVPGERLLVAAGGRGGRGNARFTSSRRQAPQFSEPGEPGIERELELELKLLAEVGIIGLPNAGKSTFISVISAAKPKIADYPFTTLTPNLGVVKKPNGDGVVVADIPGLVEGASEGVGLGHAFLRHIERTRLLVHLVDATAEEDILANYELIQRELARYSPKLANKPQMVALSKVDALSEESAECCQAMLSKGIDQPVYMISAVTRHGISALMNDILQRLESLPPEEEVVGIVPDVKAFDNDDSRFEVTRKGRVFQVSGGKVERLLRVTDLRNNEATTRFMNILKAMGVDQALVDAGAEEGHVVQIGGLEFDYSPDVSLRQNH